MRHVFRTRLAAAPLFASLLLAAFGGNAAAQVLTGSIGGVVTDSSGASIADVKITASSSSLISGSRTVNSDAGGTYKFLELPPGSYDVRFEKAGFKAFSTKGTEINTGVQVSINAKLDVGDVTQEVTVAAAAETIDTEHVTLQRVADQAVMEDVPNGRSPWAIGNTVASVTPTTFDVGGSSGMQQSTLTAHGSNGSDQKFMIDGVSVNWPGGGGGATLMYYDMGMFQEVNYLVGAQPADVSQGGVYINMITKDGSNGFHGRALLNGTWDGLEGQNVDQTTADRIFNNLPAAVQKTVNKANIVPGNPTTENFDYNGQFGGPIIRDKLWFVTSWRYWKNDNLVLGAFNTDGSQALNDNLIASEMGKFSYQMNQKNRFGLMYFRNQKNRYHRRNQGSFGDNAATVLQNQPAYEIDLKWTSVVTNSLVLDVGFALTAGKTPYRYQSDLSPSTISVYDSSTLTVYNAPQNNQLNPVYRGALDASASYFKSGWGGSHNFKFGYQQSRDGYDYKYTANGDLQGILLNGVPSTATIFNTPLDIQKNRLSVIAFYAKDTWKIGRRFTLNYGIRWEQFHATIPAQTSAAGTYVAARTYAQIDNVPNWKNWTPRLGFAWDVTGKGKTVLKGSANQYMQGQGMSLITAVNPLQFVTSSVPWNCTRPVATCISAGPLRSELNLAAFNGFAAGNTRMDPNIQRPYSWEYSVGLQQELPGGWIVSIDGWYRKTYRQIGRANQLVQRSDYTPTTIKDPFDGSSITIYNQSVATRGKVDNLITNFDSLNQFYRGIDINFSRRLSRTSMVFGGYTHGRNSGASRGDVLSGRGLDDLNNPNNDINRAGLTENDAPNIFKLGGNYMLPYRFKISGNYQHVTGYPIWATFSATSASLPAGQTLIQTSQTIYVRAPGFDRLPSVDLADIRFAREFSFHERWKFEPELDIYNVFNKGTVTGENLSANTVSLFGSPTNVLSPRILKLGLRIDF